MKQYRGLNLEKIRDDNNLDFAHYTYLVNQCSCCYGPIDLPAKYWRNHKKPVKTETEGIVMDGEPYDLNKIQYILFKNAYNGSGIKRGTDQIEGSVFVEWKMPEEKLSKVCEDLKAQLDDDYVVYRPKSEFVCILIAQKGCSVIRPEDYEEV